MVSANQIPGFLNQPFIQHKSGKEHNSLHVDINSQKLKFDWKFFSWAWLKMGVTNLVSGLWNWLYFQNEQMELTCFLHAGTISHKIKRWLKILGVSMVKNGSGEFGGGSLKLTVSEEWTGGRNWFFVCWYKLRKAKSWFKDF